MSGFQVLLIADGLDSPSPLGRFHHTELINAAVAGALGAGADGVFLCEEREENSALGEYLQPSVRRLPTAALTSCPDLDEVRRLCQEHRFGAAIFLGYRGLQSLALTVNGFPTSGLGLLGEVCAALDIPVVACFGERRQLEEANFWMPKASTLATMEKLPDGHLALYSVDETKASVRETTLLAVLDREQRKGGLLKPPFEFEYKLPKPLDSSTRPLLLDVTVKGQAFLWTTWDLLYGWKVFWEIHSRYGN